MRSLVFLLTVLAVIGLAFWAYQENYRTQRALNEMELLQREIGQARARLSVLNAEWAYLNRPDRLRDLAEINYNSLELLPFSPEQFGRVDQVAYPPTDRVPPNIAITNPVEVSNIETLSGERP